MRFDHDTTTYGLSAIYFFVEGDDYPYYASVIKGESGLPAISERCNGKDNVLKVYRMLQQKPQYSRYKTFFFVDQDFDTAPPHEDVCVTEGYSIENYYLSTSCVESILRGEFKLHPADEDGKYDLAKSLFQGKLNEYNEAISLFNAWYSCIKKRVGWDYRSVRLDSHLPMEWVKIDFHNDITPCYNLEIIKTAFENAPEVPEEEIKDEREKLMKNPSMNLRGKYEIYFLNKFMEFMSDDSSKAGNKTYTNTAYGQRIAVDKTITFLASYADVPESLRRYIRRRLA